MMQLYWVALKSIWYKEIQRFMRIWVQTLVPPVITMTLYFIIFGNRICLDEIIVCFLIIFCIYLNPSRISRTHTV